LHFGNGLKVRLSKKMEDVDNISCRAHTVLTSKGLSVAEIAANPGGVSANACISSAYQIVHWLI